MIRLDVNSRRRLTISARPLRRPVVKFDSSPIRRKRRGKSKLRISSALTRVKMLKQREQAANELAVAISEELDDVARAGSDADGHVNRAEAPARGWPWF